MTAVVRIYLPTYRRAHLFLRTVESLRAQTLQNWVCEVHNDAPDDEEPRRIISGLCDDRFRFVQHERNLGPTETFNRCFHGACEEPFYTLLEDDNWWEAGFLEEMVKVARAFPKAQVFWSNQRIWKEQSDGAFVDTGRTVRPVTPTGAPETFHWGGVEQMLWAVHSNGAMLIRGGGLTNLTIPDVPFCSVEPFRERMFPYPIVFVPVPLANFSLTINTARSRNRAELATVQAMLTASYVKHADLAGTQLAAMWRHCRQASPARTNSMIGAAFVDRSCRGQLRYSRPVDWYIFIRGIVRRPRVFLWLLTGRSRFPRWWDFLDQHTSARFALNSRDSDSRLVSRLPHGDLSSD